MGPKASLSKQSSHLSCLTVCSLVEQGGNLQVELYVAGETMYIIKVSVTIYYYKIIFINPL